ncbi:MAG: hypothetical protein KDN20_05620 [Verrucomicrobiae bacterium]|nr:hypothetical protein [Verrucomicrobiae bacterium]
MIRRLAACILCLTGVTSAEESAELRASIELALPYLETEGQWWIKEKKCVSCHHTTFFVWAKDLALEAGYPVDKTTLAEQRKWVWESFLTPIPPDPEVVEATDPNENKETPQPPEEINGDRNVEGVSQLLVSASAKFVPETPQRLLRETIASNQKSDGDWKPGGQLPRQKRPAKETQWISNQWATLALGKDAKLKAKPIMNSDAIAAKTNEWYAMNALLNPGKASIDDLLKRQNEDGGWSWMDGEASDPTGTGQALMALGRTGAAKDAEEAVAKARAFLLRTQTEDGHWETMSTKNRKESTRVSDFWGSAWAVIGLLEVER